MGFLKDEGSETGLLSRRSESGSRSRVVQRWQLLAVGVGLVFTATVLCPPWRETVAFRQGS